VKLDMTQQTRLGVQTGGADAPNEQAADAARTTVSVDTTPVLS
jgi:hypothetical protein